ncbi:hypothetical protein RLO149_c026450 [Roseobacter litoralis Och 149]|uniref:Uncharacterized protein n=1 Tax=Roseobacter litoralis (strain ATCC 49566 / DSM 6996 / JCM 21268 / NBRC 15278 / OCh 149) TaxID=391595 RepID=F7ZE95_ROSLO|nr:hypothetical protein RLO149_c026450 [Roseobacter litoralis Och 149]
MIQLFRMTLQAASNARFKNQTLHECIHLRLENLWAVDIDAKGWKRSEEHADISFNPTRAIDA